MVYPGPSVDEIAWFVVLAIETMVGSRPTKDAVGAWSADLKLVPLRTAIHDVSAISAEGGIVAGSTPKDVVAAAADEPVEIAAARKNAVIAFTTDQPIPAPAGTKQVVALLSPDDVAATEAADHVIAKRAH